MICMGKKCFGAQAHDTKHCGSNFHIFFGVGSRAQVIRPDGQRKESSTCYTLFSFVSRLGFCSESITLFLKKKKKMSAQ